MIAARWTAARWSLDECRLIAADASADNKQGVRDIGGASSRAGLRESVEACNVDMLIGFEP